MHSMMALLYEHNQLTSIGRDVAEMMVQDYHSYKDLVIMKRS